MRMIVYEGTPDEIAAFRRAMESDNSDAASSARDRTLEPDRPSSQFISVEIAKRVLARRPLSAEQRLVLRILHEAGETWTPATLLQAKLGYSKSQFAGLMGAFGRRLSQTPGYRSGTWLFDQEWNHEGGHNLYRLPRSVREALSAMDGFGG